MSWLQFNSDCVDQSKHIDAFTVTLKTDEFAPKAKRGDQLLMQYGANAEDGDIVAIYIPGNKNFTLVKYKAGVKYHAAAVLTGHVVDDNQQCVMHWFPSFGFNNLLHELANLKSKQNA
jgi:hypothetical protein